MCEISCGWRDVPWFLTRGGEYKKRYTGIHGFNVMGGVKPLSGVNLDDDEWNMLTFNFFCIKDALNGKKMH